MGHPHPPSRAVASPAGRTAVATTTAAQRGRATTAAAAAAAAAGRPPTYGGGRGGSRLPTVSPAANRPPCERRPLPTAARWVVLAATWGRPPATIEDTLCRLAPSRALGSRRHPRPRGTRSGAAGAAAVRRSLTRSPAAPSHPSAPTLWHGHGGPLGGLCSAPFPASKRCSATAVVPSLQSTLITSV